MARNANGQAYLPTLDNRDDNLTLTRSITCNVTRKLLHILHKLRFLLFRRRAAYTAPESNSLACYLALERTEK
jgi:hypothetical protein